jgi:hypothetical protein
MHRHHSRSITTVVTEDIVFRFSSSVGERVGELSRFRDPHGKPDPRFHALAAWLLVAKWPREESNLRAQIRSLPLYPLSYGA